MESSVGRHRAHIARLTIAQVPAWHVHADRGVFACVLPRRTFVQVLFARGAHEAYATRTDAGRRAGAAVLAALRAHRWMMRGKYVHLLLYCTIIWNIMCATEMLTHVGTARRRPHSPAGTDNGTILWYCCTRRARDTDALRSRTRQCPHSWTCPAAGSRANRRTCSCPPSWRISCSSDSGFRSRRPSSRTRRYLYGILYVLQNDEHRSGVSFWIFFLCAYRERGKAGDKKWLNLLPQI